MPLEGNRIVVVFTRLGVVVLKEVLSSKYYIHFLCLHVAVKLLSCGEQSRNNIEYARELLTYFVEHSQRLYSKNFVSYNVHSRDKEMSNGMEKPADDSCLYLYPVTHLEPSPPSAI